MEIILLILAYAAVVATLLGICEWVARKLDARWKTARLNVLWATREHAALKVRASQFPNMRLGSVYSWKRRDPS